MLDKYKTFFNNATAELDKRVIWKYSSYVKDALEDVRKKMKFLDEKLNSYNASAGICCDSSHK
jgi:hypothetical protein